MRLIAPVSSSAPCPILASSVPPRPSASAGQPVPKRATRKWLYLSKKGKSSKGKDPDKKALRKCGGPSLFQYLRLPRPGRRRVQQRLIGRQRPHVLDGTPRSQHRHDRLARSREKVDAECVDIPLPVGRIERNIPARLGLRSLVILRSRRIEIEYLDIRIQVAPQRRQVHLDIVGENGEVVVDVVDRLLASAGHLEHADGQELEVA